VDGLAPRKTLIRHEAGQSFRPHRFYGMRIAATDVTLVWCVCRHSAKTAEQIEVLFGIESPKVPSDTVLCMGPDPSSTSGSGVGETIVRCRVHKYGCTDAGRFIRQMTPRSMR